MVSEQEEKDYLGVVSLWHSSKKIAVSPLTKREGGKKKQPL